MEMPKKSMLFWLHVEISVSTGNLHSGSTTRVLGSTTRVFGSTTRVLGSTTSVLYSDIINSKSWRLQRFAMDLFQYVSQPYQEPLKP
jgi:hypothetical protein